MADRTGLGRIGLALAGVTLAVFLAATLAVQAHVSAGAPRAAVSSPR